MKNACSLLIAGAFAATPLAAQQWHHRQGGRVLDVFTRDGIHAWTAEDGGRIRHTSDGGQTWSFQSTPDDVRAPLNGIVFLADGVTGWAVGTAGVVLGTTDGGAHWQHLAVPPVLDGLGQPAKLHDVHFHDASRGWVVGDDLVLQWTSDGGATWSSGPPGTGIAAAHGYDPDGTPPNYYAVTFLDEYVGFVAGGHGLLLRTYDGGELWERVELVGVPSNVHLWDVEFTGWRGVVVGGAGNQKSWRLVTLDGGQTWFRDGCSLTLGPTQTTQYGLVLFDEGGGLSCGYGSQILLKQGDGDACWSGSPPFAGQTNGTVPLRAASGDEHHTAWVVGEFGTIRRTIDKGFSWKNQGTTMALRPGAVHLVDEHTGFVAGQHQRIVKTTDQGAIWREVYTGPSSARIRSIAFDLQGATGLAAGEAWQGPSSTQILLVISRDEGESWQPVSLPPGVPTVDLLAVTFRRDGVAWAAGADGLLLSSEDDGQTWRHHTTAAITHTIESIAFGSDPQRGFVVGLQGAWRTADGGDSWQPVPVLAAGGVGRLRDVSVLGADDAWAVGNEGEVYRYAPGADVFQRITLPFALDKRLDAVAAVTSTHSAQGLQVFVVGQGGVALHFDGTSWSAPKSSSSQDLVDLSFVSPELGFAVGSQTFTLQVYR